MQSAANARDAAGLFIQEALCAEVERSGIDTVALWVGHRAHTVKKWMAGSGRMSADDMLRIVMRSKVLQGYDTCPHRED